MKRIQRKWRLALAGLLVIAVVIILWTRWRPAKRFNGAPRNADDLRIMTWNVGYFAPIMDKNIRELDLSPVAELIKDTHVDVVILQELICRSGSPKCPASGTIVPLW